MNLAELRQAATRCWYVVLAGSLCMVALILISLQVVPVSYETKAEVLLLPPQTTTGPGGNPYLSLSGLQSTADVVSRSVMGDELASSAAVSDHFVVETDRTTSGPLLLVTVTDSIPQRANQTLDFVVRKIPETLAGLQAASSVKPAFWITAEVITSQQVPTALHKNQVRAAIVAGVVGVVGTMAAVALVDRLLLLRRRRRSAYDGAGGGLPDRRSSARQVVSEQDDVFLSALSDQAAGDLRIAVDKDPAGARAG